jgi:hypothetical protein
MSDTHEAVDPESFVSLLDAIRDILLRYDYLAQATLVADLIDLARLHSSDFADKLGDGGIWGSAGSVADVVDLRPSLDPVDAKTRQDSLDLQHLLIRLADEMKAQGISSKRSEFVGNAFRRGLESWGSRDDPRA